MPRHQKPRSARPTQLNANIDEAIAVNATMVLMDRKRGAEALEIVCAESWEHR